MDWKVVQYALYVRYMNRHKKVPDWTFAAPRTTADVDARGRRARGRPFARAVWTGARAASGVDARAVGERERERERGERVPPRADARTRAVEAMAPRGGAVR